MQGAAGVLREARPRWLIELHGENCQREVGRILRETEYDIFDLSGKKLEPPGSLPRHILARPR